MRCGQTSPGRPKGEGRTLGKSDKSLPNREKRTSEQGASTSLVLRDGFRPLDGAFIIAPICA